MSAKDMSLRDWLAGQALPSVIAATSAGQHQPVMLAGEEHIRHAIARDAYEMAEAMLAAREVFEARDTAAWVESIGA